MRVKLAERFHLLKSSGVQSFSENGVTRILSDGHTESDLAAITVELLQKELGSKETDFWKLMERAIGEADGSYREPEKKVKTAKAKDDVQVQTKG